MGKYDVELDLSTKNSLSIIIKHLEANSRVLEFGPANGRLTKYMTEQMNCEVDIVEIDQASGEDAARYAKNACLGPIEGDAEKNIWFEKLKHEHYDYIIFADILEHLRNPRKLLTTSKGLLKENGKILVSVPNIANNAIIANLLRNQFCYTPTGLLDNTHIHFFTGPSFMEMAAESGFHVHSVEGTYQEIGESEVPVSYHDLDRDVIKILKARPGGDVYQYIFVLEDSKNTTDKTTRYKIDTIPRYICECYIRTAKQRNFDANHRGYKLISGYHTLPAEEIAEFDVSGYKNIEEIRIDPINANIVLQIEEIYGMDSQNNRINLPYIVNGEKIDNICVFDTDDPQILCACTSIRELRKIIIRYKILSYDNADIGLFWKEILKKR